MSGNHKINILDIYHQGKKYSWHRPRCKCGSHVHGHGFVTRYFNRFKNFLFIKRWRCPKCHAVITARPDGYWPRFQESIFVIFETLKFRIKNFKWPPWMKRQRAGHWIKKLLTNSKLNNLTRDNVYETILFYQDKDLCIN